MKEEISAILLHQPTESQRQLKQALEERSIKVNWLRNYAEALPLLREADPPHLVFTEASLPDGTWTDVVKLALEALKPVKVIVVSRVFDMRLYIETMTGGAFDFIVPPMTNDELAHVLACAVESVLNLRRPNSPSRYGQCHQVLPRLVGVKEDMGLRPFVQLFDGQKGVSNATSPTRPGRLALPIWPRRGDPCSP